MRKILLLFLFNCLIINIPAQNSDLELLRKIQQNRNQSLDGTFKFISTNTASFSIGSPFVIFATGYFKKDSALKYKGVYIAGAMLGTALISTILKQSINRTRPFNVDTGIHKLTSGGSPSFPSGHTSDAFVTATSISIVFPKWYVIAPAYLWASAVAYSRMSLGVHYPSDVAAGAILGSGSAYLCYKLNNWIFAKRRSKAIIQQ